jgi:hypothetical protein
MWRPWAVVSRSKLDLCDAHSEPLGVIGVAECSNALKMNLWRVQPHNVRDASKGVVRKFKAGTARAFHQAAPFKLVKLAFAPRMP